MLSSRLLVALTIAVGLLGLAPRCAPIRTPGEPGASILLPAADQLSLVGDIEVGLVVPGYALQGTSVVKPMVGSEASAKASFPSSM